MPNLHKLLYNKKRATYEHKVHTQPLVNKYIMIDRQFIIPLVPSTRILQKEISLQPMSFPGLIYLFHFLIILLL